jgi:hypothetical protein
MYSPVAENIALIAIQLTFEGTPSPSEWSNVRSHSWTKMGPRRTHLNLFCWGLRPCYPLWCQVKVDVGYLHRWDNIRWSGSSRIRLFASCEQALLLAIHAMISSSLSTIKWTCSCRCMHCTSPKWQSLASWHLIYLNHFLITRCDTISFLFVFMKIFLCMCLVSVNWSLGIICVK